MGVSKLWNDNQMRVLDLFCGMGGWSIGFWRQGFDCVGVDIVDVGYPYRLIQKDVRDIHQAIDKFDVIVASPPCQEFSNGRYLNMKKGGLPPRPEMGMELVRECKRVIDLHEPRYWAIENVRGSVPHISQFLGEAPSYQRSPQYVWGNLPLGLMADHYFEKYTWNNGTNYLKLKSLMRGIIPLPLSIAAAESVTRK